MGTVSASRIRTAVRIGIGAVAATAVATSIVVLPPPADAAAASTTVRGTVIVDGAPIAGVPVGTWSPSKGVVATGRTDSRGRFTLRSPSGVAVDAFAGTKPSASHAVFAADGAHLVRGVIGASAPTAHPEVLYETVSRALPRHLGGGGALRFDLERAGRFTASSPVLGRSVDVTGAIEIERGDGVNEPEYTASEAGTITSGWLVPGRYHLYWDPSTATLPARSWVTVRPGTTVAATAPNFSAGATLAVHATSGGAPLPAGVPVVENRGTAEDPAPSTDATGTMTERTVAPGSYRFTIGQFFDDPDEGLEGPPSTDDYLPKAVVVTVAKGATVANATVALLPASKVSGTVIAPSGSTVEVLAENSSRTVVRTGFTDSGAFTLGGLPAGSYTVFAVDTDHHRYDSEHVTLAAATSIATPPVALSRALQPSIAEPTIHGTVGGRSAGTVDFESAAVHGAVLYVAPGEVSTSGHYSVRTVPARLSPVVAVAGHAATRSRAVVFSRSTVRDFGPGPKLATVTVRFRARGHAVREEVLAADRAGDELDLQHAKPVGRSIASGVVPGRYTWTQALQPLPAADGPWYFLPPKGSFTVHAGRRNDLGTKTLGLSG